MAWTLSSIWLSPRSVVMAGLVCLAAARIADPNVARTRAASVSQTSMVSIVTPPPSAEVFELRQLPNSLCGYGYIYNTFLPITCPSGIPCEYEFVDTNYVAWCSEPGSLPTTHLYDYGGAPAGACGVGGVACCPSQDPFYEKFEFDGGQTVLLWCGTWSNNPTFTATTALPPSTEPQYSSMPTITDPNGFGITSTPTPSPTPGGSGAHHSGPTGSNKSASFGGLSIGGWIGIGISAIIGIVGIIVAIFFGVTGLIPRPLLAAWSKWCCCGDCSDRLDRANETRNLSSSNIHYHPTENPTRMEYTPTYRDR